VRNIVFAAPYPRRPVFRALAFGFNALTASSTYFGMTGKKPRSYRVIVFRAMPSLSASSRCVRPRRSLRFRSSRPVKLERGYLREQSRSMTYQVSDLKESLSAAEPVPGSANLQRELRDRHAFRWRRYADNRTERERKVLSQIEGDSVG